MLDEMNRPTTATQGITGAEAGLSGEEQIRIAMETIARNDGVATMPQLYAAVEARLGGRCLSSQGKASLRFFVNKVAVNAGYVRPFDKTSPGWRLTPDGYEVIAPRSESPDTDGCEDATRSCVSSTNSAYGAAFERYVLDLLKAMYPYYAWYHQGQHKRTERGLDLIGDRVGDLRDEPRRIGVQVKFHQADRAPAETEWLRFLAGCFARRVDAAIFVTSGRLTGEQRREASEANVRVIEGREEIQRIGRLFQLPEFVLFEPRLTEPMD
jgi:hypothetical protein